jgi:MFS family permease
MGWFTMPALIGPLIGPPLAGLVLSVADWPWIFYLNLPVGVLGMIAVMRFVPKGQPAARSGASTPWASCCRPWRSAAWWWWPRRRGLSLAAPAGPIDHAAVSLCAGWLYLRKAKITPRPILDLSLLQISAPIAPACWAGPSCGWGSGPARS